MKPANIIGKLKTDNVGKVLKSLGYKAMPNKRPFNIVRLGNDKVVEKTEAGKEREVLVWVGFYYHVEKQIPLVVDGKFIRKAKPADLAQNGISFYNSSESKKIIDKLPDDLKAQVDKTIKELEAKAAVPKAAEVPKKAVPVKKKPKPEEEGTPKKAKAEEKPAKKAEGEVVVSKALKIARIRLKDFEMAVESMKNGGSKADIYRAERELWEQKKYIAALERGESVPLVDFSAVIKRADAEYYFIETVTGGMKYLKDINMTGGLSKEELEKSVDRSLDLGGVSPKRFIEQSGWDEIDKVAEIALNENKVMLSSKAELERLVAVYQQAYARLFENLDAYFHYNLKYIPFSDKFEQLDKVQLLPTYAYNTDVAIRKTLDYAYSSYPNSVHVAVWIEKAPPSRSIDVLPDAYLKQDYKNATIVPSFDKRGKDDYKINQIVVKDDKVLMTGEDKKTARQWIDQNLVTTAPTPDQPVPSAPAVKPAPEGTAQGLTPQSIEAFAKKKAKKVKVKPRPTKIASCVIDGKLLKAFLSFIDGSGQGDDSLIWWTSEGFTSFNDSYNRGLYVSHVHLSKENFSEFHPSSENVPMVFPGSLIKTIKDMLKPGKKPEIKEEPKSSGRLSGFKPHKNSALLNNATGSIYSLEVALQYGVKGNDPVFSIIPMEDAAVKARFDFGLRKSETDLSFHVKESEELYQKLQPDGEYGQLFTELPHATFYAPLDVFMEISTKTTGISKDDDPSLFVFDGQILHVYAHGDLGNRVFQLETLGVLEATKEVLESSDKQISVLIRNTTALRNLAKTEIFHKIPRLKALINNAKGKRPIMIKDVEYPDKSRWISYKGYAIVPFGRSDYHVLRKKPIEFIDRADTEANAKKLIDGLKYDEKVKKMPRVKLGISQDGAFMFETKVKGQNSMLKVIVFSGEAEKEFKETEDDDEDKQQEDNDEQIALATDLGQTTAAQVAMAQTPYQSKKSKRNHSVGTVYDFKADWQQMDQPHGLFIEMSEDKFVPIKKKDVKGRVVVKLKYEAGARYLKKRGLSYDWQNKKIVKAKIQPKEKNAEGDLTYQQQLRRLPKAWDNHFKELYKGLHGTDRSAWPSIPDMPDDWADYVDRTLKIDENLDILLDLNNNYKAKKNKANKNKGKKGKDKEYWTVLEPHEIEQLNWIEKEIMKDEQEGPEIFKEMKSKIVMTPPDKRNAVFAKIIADLKEAAKYD